VFKFENEFEKVDLSGFKKEMRWRYYGL